ncbi:MAG: DUF3098 domain-containing protein [Rikenellaceae bacterium]|nr:DUF3098 domain-containing protein [Rikenellaceae bacterium]
MANTENNLPQENPNMPLTKRNYIILAIGFAIVLVGFLLMMGGGSHSATEFDESIFSFRRITLAPILVVGGFVVEIYGILKRF